CPCSAAYCSSWIALTLLPWMKARVPDLNASMIDIGFTGATACGVGFSGSSATALPAQANTSAAAAEMRMVSNIRIGLVFNSSTGMGHGTVARIANLLRVLPEVSGLGSMLARLPGFFPFGKFAVGKFYVERAG